MLSNTVPPSYANAPRMSVKRARRSCLWKGGDGTVCKKPRWNGHHLTQYCEEHRPRQGVWQRHRRDMVNSAGNNPALRFNLFDMRSSPVNAFNDSVIGVQPTLKCYDVGVQTDSVAPATAVETVNVPVLSMDTAVARVEAVMPSSLPPYNADWSSLHALRAQEILLNKMAYDLSVLGVPVQLLSLMDHIVAAPGDALQGVASQEMMNSMATLWSQLRTNRAAAVAAVDDTAHKLTLRAAHAMLQVASAQTTSQVPRNQRNPLQAVPPLAAPSSPIVSEPLSQGEALPNFPMSATDAMGGARNAAVAAPIPLRADPLTQLFGKVTVGKGP
jgi:hypothetical protein